MPKQAAKKIPQKPTKKAATKKVAAKVVSVTAPPSPPTHSQIAEQAHHLWQQHGSRHGAHVEHWLEAERQLKDK